MSPTARLRPASGAFRPGSLERRPRAGRALSAAFAAAENAGVEAHGIWNAAEVETAVASTAGTAVAEAVTDAFMKVVCIAPAGRSGYAAATSRSVGGLEAPQLADSAVAKATQAGDPAKLPAGEYPVVFEHHAVAALLGM